MSAEEINLCLWLVSNVWQERCIYYKTSRSLKNGDQYILTLNKMAFHCVIHCGKNRAVASLLVRLTPGRAVRIRALTGDTVLSF